MRIERDELISDAVALGCFISENPLYITGQPKLMLQQIYEIYIYLDNSVAKLLEHSVAEQKQREVSCESKFRFNLNANIKIHAARFTDKNRNGIMI